MDWIGYLTVTGHLKREGDPIAAPDVRQLEAIHQVMEADRSRRAVARDAQLMPSLRSEQIYWEADGGSDCPRDIAAVKGRGWRDERRQACLCLPRPFPQIRDALVGGAVPWGGDNTRAGGAPSNREGSGEPAPFLVAQRPLPPPLDCGPSVPPRVDWTLGPD